MKILKFKKEKNKYRIYFDNNKDIALYESIILKNELLLKKTITENELKKIIKENQKEEIYENSIKYINVKMRSKKEIESYLKRKEYNLSDIEITIKRLEKEKYIDDEKYVKAYIYDKLNLSTDGPFKIRYNLINNNIDERIVDKYIENIDSNEIRDRLDLLIDKKIKTIKNCSGNILKLKLLNYFSNLGYDKYMIDEILSNKELNNDNGEKEYYKLLNKYSKKYSGYELENIIKQKLYQKGYNLDEIKRNIN